MDFSNNFWLKDFKLRLFLRNSRTHWTSIDGESLKVPIQILGRTFRKSKLSKRDWSRRPKRLSRKTSSSKRKRNSTSSSRTSSPDNQAQKLLSNFQSINRTWRRRPVKWRPWLPSWTCTKLKSTSTNMKSKDLPESSKTWRESTTSRREESRCREKLSKDLSQELLTKLMLRFRDLLVEVSTLLFEQKAQNEPLSSQTFKLRSS